MPTLKVTQLNLYLREVDENSPQTDIKFKSITKYHNVEEFTVINGVVSFWHYAAGKREHIITNLPFKIICEEA